MNQRWSLSLLVSFPFAAVVALAAGGCTQPWDSQAAHATNTAPPPPAENLHSRVIMTPNIELVSGRADMVTTTGCEATRFQVLNDDEEKGPLGILVQECSGCHGETGTAGPEFNFVLDVPKLIDPQTLGRGVCGPAAGRPAKRFVVAGDPTNSCILQRMQTGQMPPSNPPGINDSVTPSAIDVPATISEMSIIYEWIAHCLAPSPASPSGAGGA